MLAAAFSFSLSLLSPTEAAAELWLFLNPHLAAALSVSVGTCRVSTFLQYSPSLSLIQ